MAEPIDFLEADYYLGPAPGDEKRVGTLPVKTGPYGMASLWRLNDDELNTIMETGCVALLVSGAHPPVAVFVPGEGFTPCELEE